MPPFEAKNKSRRNAFARELDMNANDRFNAILERSKESNAYWVEKAIIECTEEMIARMKSGEISRSELARRMGKNPAFVTKLLRGNNNFTFETAVKIARDEGVGPIK